MRNIKKLTAVAATKSAPSNGAASNGTSNGAPPPADAPVKRPLPFRAVSNFVTHDANPVSGAVFEARSADGRVMEIQITHGLNAVTWDGSFNADGSPKVDVNANYNVTARWKPTAPVTEPVVSPAPAGPASPPAGA